MKSVTFLPRTFLLMVYMAPGTSWGRPDFCLSLFLVMLTRYFPTVLMAPRVSDIRAMVLSIWRSGGLFL